MPRRLYRWAWRRYAAIPASSPAITYNATDSERNNWEIDPGQMPALEASIEALFLRNIAWYGVADTGYVPNKLTRWARDAIVPLRGSVILKGPARPGARRPPRNPDHRLLAPAKS